MRSAKASRIGFLYGDSCTLAKSFRASSNSYLILSNFQFFSAP
jgi:hypothetical protein